MGVRAVCLLVVGDHTHVEDCHPEGEVVTDIGGRQSIGSARVETSLEAVGPGKISTFCPDPRSSPDSHSDHQSKGNEHALALDIGVCERKQPPRDHEERDPDLDADGLAKPSRDGLEDEDYGRVQSARWSRGGDQGIYPQVMKKRVTALLTAVAGIPTSLAKPTV